MPTPAERLVDQARDEEARDGAAAERLYRDSLELAPHDPAATVGLARVLLATGRVDEARVLVESLESRGFLEPEAERLKAELALRGSAASAGAVETAQAALAAAPDDPERQRKLAEALAAASRYDEALEICLRLVENDRKGVGESARKTMLAIFQLLPADSELAADYRRKLSAALY
jgi:putative thioredoxin